MSRIENTLIMPKSKEPSEMSIAVIDIDEPVKTKPFQRMQPKTAEETVRIARKTFKSEKTLPVSFRLAQLKNLRRMYDETEGAMMEALGKDLRKCKFETSITEIEMLKNDVTNLIMHLKEWMKPTKAPKDIANLLNELRIYKDPYGLVLIMGAWNYPLQLSLLPLAGAIAGGNCVIIKPSELAEATAAYITEYMPKYIDADCYQVFEGGVTETTALLAERFDYIFFTGSPQVGKIVHQAAAKYLTPTTLELGGKSPVYIDATADIDITAARLIWGKCVNLGQTCIAPDYVLCTKEVQDRLIPAIKKTLIEWFGKNPKQSPDLCRVITDRHFDRLIKLMQNGKIALGGDSDARERYIEPTILTDVNPNDPVMTDEIFGPILPFYNINNIHEAIRFINAREKPLALYIFSKNNKDVELMLSTTSSGGACVNDTLMHVTTEGLPFGGVGNSGMGNYHGQRSFDVFVHPKSVMKKSLAAIPEMVQMARYPPYSDAKLSLLSFVLKKRPEFPTSFFCYLLVFIAGFITALLYKCMRD